MLLLDDTLSLRQSLCVVDTQSIVNSWFVLPTGLVTAYISYTTELGILAIVDSEADFLDASRVLSKVPCREVHAQPIRVPCCRCIVMVRRSHVPAGH